jgi:hypothetical protein
MFNFIALLSRMEKDLLIYSFCVCVYALRNFWASRAHSQGTITIRFEILGTSSDETAWKDSFILLVPRVLNSILEENSKLHFPAALPSRNYPLYPMDMELNKSQETVWQN